MAAKMRFLDELNFSYNIYIYELLMPIYFDKLDLKMTYKVCFFFLFFLYKVMHVRPCQ